MTGIDNQPAGTRETAADRRVKALDLRKAGHSYRAIGAELGISVAQAHDDVQRALAALAKLERQTAEEYRALELARLDTLAVEAMRVLLATHPLISGGKVLSGFTDEGTAIGLTDDGPKLAAIEKLIRISESRRKLLGLDKPTLVAPTNPDGTPYSGDYAVLRAAVLAVLAPYPELRIQIAAQLAALPERTDDNDQPTA